MIEYFDENWNYKDGNWIHKTAIINPNVEMGIGNVIGPYTVIGSNGEMRGVQQYNFKGGVIIGDNNVISEFVSIQRPYKEHTYTKIGSNNIIMAHVHVGHDVIICSNCEICTGSIIGGYVFIGDSVKIKLNCVIRNRIKIQPEAIVGMGSVVVKDVIEGSIVYGNPAKTKKNV